MAPSIVPTTDDVLLVVDVQNDFCANGALAVPDGDAVVPITNRLAACFPHSVATQDWHPPQHLSFASSHDGKAPFDTVTLDYGEQILWPDHCVQDSPGAAFHPDLALSCYELIIRKGTRKGIDSYSAFYENDQKTATGLAGYLRECGLKRVFLVGLAGDVCVLYSALDAARLGFETFFIEDACRSIGGADQVAECRQKLTDAGIHLIMADTILGAGRP